MFRENLGIRAGLRRAPGNGLGSCLVKTLAALARAVLLSLAGTSPTGVDEIFVPSNGVITLNLNRPPAKKKTEGLQYTKGRDSCFVSRENLEGRGPGGSFVSSRRVRDGRGWAFCSRQRRHHSQPKPAPGRKKD